MKCVPRDQGACFHFGSVLRTAVLPWPPWHTNSFVSLPTYVITAHTSLLTTECASLLVQNCTDGYYCAEGAAAALPCPGGTTKRLRVTMMRKEDCDICGVGTFCPVGSSTATNCSAGTYNDKPKQEACAKCAVGTFQDVEGATGCLGCTDGYYCAEGAAAALPCPGGTTKRLGIVMVAKEDCDICGEGKFCPVGSAVATKCSAGTYNDQSAQEACTKCAAGEFQDKEGATACSACKRGFFCLEGASVALPCPGNILHPFRMSTAPLGPMAAINPVSHAQCAQVLTCRLSCAARW